MFPKICAFSFWQLVDCINLFSFSKIYLTIYRYMKHTQIDTYTTKLIIDIFREVDRVLQRVEI